MLDRLARISVNTYVAPYPVAAAYAGMNRKEQALEWLEKAYQEHYPRMFCMRLDPRFDSLHSDERFKAYLHRLHLDS
jgi:hypothetical protein